MLLFEPPFRQILIAVTSGFVVCLLAFLGYRSRPGKSDWQRVTPGPTMWFGIILGLPLLLVFIYVRVFVGSSRSDAASQMNWLTGLIVAFGLGVPALLWFVHQIRKQDFNWRGTWIAYSTSDGNRIVRSIDEIIEIKRTHWGWFVLRFSDGESIRLSESARGTYEFLDTVAERFPDPGFRYD